MKNSELADIIRALRDEVASLRSEAASLRAEQAPRYVTVPTWTPQTWRPTEIWCGTNTCETAAALS